MVEQPIRNRQVASSTLALGSILFNTDVSDHWTFVPLQGLALPSFQPSESIAFICDSPTVLTYTFIVRPSCCDVESPEWFCRQLQAREGLSRGRAEMRASRASGMALFRSKAWASGLCSDSFLRQTPQRETPEQARGARGCRDARLSRFRSEKSAHSAAPACRRGGDALRALRPVAGQPESAHGFVASSAH